MTDRIYIKDVQAGEYFGTTVDLTNDNKTIVVRSIESLPSNKEFALYIEDTIYSSTGSNKLDKGIVVYFNTK